MTWVGEIAKTDNSVITLAQLFPRRYVSSGWTLSSGSIYYQDFTDVYIDPNQCDIWEGYSAAVPAVSMTSLVQKTSLAGIVGAGQYFWDSSINRLYVRTTTSVNPNTATIIFEYLILISTKGMNHYRRLYAPSNDSYQEIYYEGVIIREPLFRQSLSDVVYGFLPTESSQIVLNNAGKYFNPFLYSDYFKNARIHIYQQFGAKATDGTNPQMVYRGLMGNFNIQGEELSIEVRSEFTQFDKEYVGTTFRVTDAGYAGLTFSVDDKDKYIPKVYGRVWGISGVNADYNDTPATNNNRKWILQSGLIASKPSYSQLVVFPSASTTTTSTKVADVTGLCLDDRLVILINSVKNYAFITAINTSTNVITHSTIGNRAATIGTDTVTRGFVSHVTLTDNTGKTFHITEDDYTATNFVGTAQDSCGVTLADNFESRVTGFPAIFNPSTMKIQFTVYGAIALSTASITYAASSHGGAVSNPVDIFTELMSVVDLDRQIANGKLTNYINYTALNTLADTVPQLVGLCIPESGSTSLPTFKSLMVTVLNSFLGQMHYAAYSSGDSSPGPKITVTKVAPTSTTPDFTLTLQDIISIDYSSDYNDLPSDLLFKFLNWRGALANNGLSGPNIGTPIGSLGTDGVFAAKNSNIKGRYSSDVRKTLELDTFLWHDSDISSTSDIGSIYQRFVYLFSERRMLVTVQCRASYYEADIGDTIEIDNVDLPGYALTTTTRTRRYKLIEKRQSSQGVILVLDDQKGVEDNSASW